MGRKKYGRYVFVTYAGDHRPYHVHICDKDGKELGRWNIEDQVPMDVFRVTKEMIEGLEQLGYRTGDKK